jgi:hypothetical protein
VIADALAFLRDARRDEALNGAVAALGDDATWEALAALGAGAGLRFTAAELQEAHALDWRLRWARYSGSDAAAP